MPLVFAKNGDCQPFVMTGAGPLPTKQPPRLTPATTNANANASFFIVLPLSID
jgi:hypothetical protein